VRLDPQEQVRARERRGIYPLTRDCRAEIGGQEVIVPSGRFIRILNEEGEQRPKEECLKAIDVEVRATGYKGNARPLDKGTLFLVVEWSS
jgi:hypothetical protein